MSQDGKKIDCSSCNYRGEIPGSVLIRCCHPDLCGTTGSAEIAEPAPIIRDDVSKMKVLVAMRTLEIRGTRVPDSLVAYKQGVFLWPIQYSQVYLAACNGYEAREEPRK